MAALGPTGIDDMVKSILAKFDRKQWVDISQPYQNYQAVKAVLANKVKKEGGVKLTWDVQVDYVNNARMTGLYAVENTIVRNVLQQASADWRKMITSWSYDIHEEKFQGNLETIIDHLKVKEYQSQVAYWKLLEDQMWTIPTSSTDNHLNGIPYYLVKVAAGEEGFLGGHPSGHSEVAGLSRTTYPNWKNYGFDYTAVTKDDLVSKIRKAVEFTNFESPEPFPELRTGSSKFQHFTTSANVFTMERMLEAQNDSLGNDVMPKFGKVMVKGNPVSWVKYLDDNDSAAAPWYGINWNVFQFFHNGTWLTRTEPMMDASQPSARSIFYWSWCNLRCLDPRQAGFVGAKI